MTNDEKTERKIPDWENYNGLHRIKVDGGYIYESIDEVGVSLVFVPDIDLKRYQSHLRDAYTQGYKDGQEDSKNGVVNSEEGLIAYDA